MKTLSAVCAVVMLGCGPQLSSVEDDSYEEASSAICADPDGCVVESPLPSVGTPTLSARSQTSLTLQLKLSTSWTSWAVERRAPGGSWLRAGGGNRPTTTTRSYVDSGRTPDARSCYRLKATNEAGSAYSGEVCGLTQPPANVPNPGLNRLQLKLKIADVSDAQTTDRISVKLSQLGLPGYNHTGLNAAPRPTINPLVWQDDFARGSEFTYDLQLRNLSRLRDISEVTLTKSGTDAVCVERVELLVNGRSAVVRSFGVATCRWLDGDRGYSNVLAISFDELRAMPSFAQFVNPLMSPNIQREELEARLEGIIGDAIWARNDVVWGAIYNRAVEVSGVNLSTVHTDLDLLAKRSFPYPDAEVDIDFDVNVSFARNASNNGYDVVFDVQNFRSGVDLPWWTEVLGAVCYVAGSNCATYIERYVEDSIEAGFSVSSQRIPAVSDADLQARGCTVPTVQIDASPMVQFGCR